MVHGRRSVELPWPDHPELPGHAVALRRDLLDSELRRVAAAAGAHVLMGHRAMAPVVERGFVRGATFDVDTGLADDAPRHREVAARFVVVADGANSTFGRSLGTTRQRSWPYGIVTRTYYATPRSGEPLMESVLAPPDAQDHSLAGFGWAVPAGNGTVNVGIASLSTYRNARAINALKQLDSFARSAADRWGFDPDRQLKRPTRFRLPLAGSVGPKMGPTFLVVGDAGGEASPFNGDGVDAALATGRLAAEVLDEALTVGNSTTLQRYPTLLADQLGDYQKVGRLTARILGRPAVLRSALAVTFGNRRVLGGALRIATNELREGHPRGGAERAYALADALARFAPGW
jgi:flavin-dependent dehydrogenase